MKTHELKIWPEYFDAMWKGHKMFTVRQADRDFRLGDLIHFREFNPTTAEYTGSAMELYICYILPGGRLGIAEGYCVLGLSLFDD